MQVKWVVRDCTDGEIHQFVLVVVLVVEMDLFLRTRTSHPTVEISATLGFKERYESKEWTHIPP